VQEGGSTTAAVPEKSAASVPLWSRSVGSMKCQLSGLIRPKTTAPSTVSSSACCSTAVAPQESATCLSNSYSELDSKSNCENNGPSGSEQQSSGGNVVSAGLAGLGAYSSTSGSENDEESN